MALAHESFGVTDDELAMSRDIVERYEQAAAEGVGVIAIGGQMIEAIARRARAVLARHAATSGTNLGTS